MDTVKTPSPGSDEADKLGCTCPRMDNAYGRGAWGTWDKPEGEKVFFVNGNCPVHAKDGKPDNG